MKRAKEHKKLVSELANGDEVVTNGGLLGRITNVGESFVTVELADNVRIKVQRHAVASVMPKGTIKSA
jgi:preprotein translocase subunit YajC